MIIESQIEKTRQVIRGWQKNNYSIGLVPTMGYFHDGHISLMTKAHQSVEKVVVSLFVNPSQFGPGEDLEKYPQDPEGDAKLADQAGVDLLFCPAVSDMYQEDNQTTVQVSRLSQGMCGIDRPIHFKGVATVVSKLFNIIMPNVAVFGEKDFQQLAVIKQMVADLHFPIQIVGHEIVREADGLAMSSRNAYLTAEERGIATILFKALGMIKKEVEFSTTVLESEPLLKSAEQLITHYPQCSVDYLTIVNSSTLEPKFHVDHECRVAGAITINSKIRLIDNLALTPAL